MSGKSTVLTCVQPGSNASWAVRSAQLPSVGPGEVLVGVGATAVNPIDVKRVSGYGRKLLGLLGASGPEVVLGNDFSGRVLGTGEGITDLRAGDPVFGVLPTGKQGAHRSHLAVPRQWVRRLPANASPIDVSALPYTFCTLWRALLSLGLTADSARGKRVLLHGGSGALGQLGIQLLSFWGAKVTVTCSARHIRRCMDLGASVAVDRLTQGLEALPANFDATLNFGAWDDEPRVLARLGPQAMGHATTVHPLLAAFDQYGWVGGAVRVLFAKRRMTNLLRARAPRGSYTWVVFKPDEGALDALTELVRQNRLQLEVGLSVPFEQASLAFEHVGKGSPARAVLIPHLGRTK